LTERPTYNIEQEKSQYAHQLTLWETAFGLQATDGLEPSAYMRELAEENARGQKSYEQVYQDISRYHETTNNSTREADLVSLRIKEYLARGGFTLSPATLLAIHKEIFKDGFTDSRIKVGQFRTYNISKAEKVLAGESVVYADYSMIRESLDYDFDREKSFDYRGLTAKDKVEHLTDFISGIWQIHPFGEGNTRTITVFLIKYFEQFGFKLNNESFKTHAAYFRDALVMANAPLSLDRQTDSYLRLFMGNIALDAKNKLEDLRK
jgi:fido (protein-threonine AMPylation protein)